MVMAERIYSIPLNEVKHKSPSTKRAAKAMRHIRQFIARHMKNENVRIGDGLNKKVWERGMENIPSKVKVRARAEEDGSVSVELAE